MDAEMDDTTRSNLEEQRDFLLASLRDLERERAAGDVDDADYEALSSSYTARAADIIRRLEAGAAPHNPPVEGAMRRKRTSRRVLGAIAVVAVAAVLGVFVARQSGQRLPGETASGGIADSTANKLAQARQLNFNDPITAINIYTDVLKVDPDNVEALTYRSWLLALTARDAEAAVRDVAVQTAILGLGRATLLDDTYPDAHCFLGIVSYRFVNDVATAKRELAKCEAADPPAQVKGFVDAIVAEIEAAG
ncbi:MAG: hypothetical protein EBV24_06680 [Actinobacteria bacterium]|jgi:hypothetical protein|nr:hypothetical protein [Actinomycetota bacterium]